MKSLRFSTKNVKLAKLEKKLKKKVVSISLLAGTSCPFAKECKSRIKIVKGKRKVVDGKYIKFRCYSASSEALRKNVYENHLNNFNILRKLKKISMLEKAIDEGLPSKYDIVRIHSNGGDFFSLNYFKAWRNITRLYPDKIFYAYTKAIPYWVSQIKTLPDNFILNASYGGTHDYLIDEYGLKSAKVVFSVEEASKLNLKIDYDDSLASSKDCGNFALLLHGTQPKKSDASIALQKLK